MDITDVRIKMLKGSSERLRAFCSVTLDDAFVIRDVKVIDGSNGPFVAMPSRKISDRCPKCGGKNHMRARFCNDCGAKLKENRIPKDDQGRAKLHAEIAHPIKTEFRERIQHAVIEAYEKMRGLEGTEGEPAAVDFDDDVFMGVEDFESAGRRVAVSGVAPHETAAPASAKRPTMARGLTPLGEGFDSGIE